MFETVIGPFNGDVKLDNNSYRTSSNSTTDGSYTTAITNERAPIALKAARYAIAKPYEVTTLQSLQLPTWWHLQPESTAAKPRLSLRT